MKLLHLITSLKIGGAESALVNFLSHAQRYGHEHHVVYFHAGPNVQALQNLGIPTYHITGLVSCYDPVALYRLKKLISTINPDIIHSALWSANILGRLFGRHFGIPIICDLHGDCQAEGKFRNMLDRATVNIPRYIVAVSESVNHAYRKTITPQQSGLASRIVTINNGIDAQALRTKALQNPLTRHELGLEDTDFVIGSIGRLEPIKSYDILIKAFALMLAKSSPEQQAIYGVPKLCIVGDGSEMLKIKNLAVHLGIQDKVLLPGFRTDAPRFYPLFNCFALSSQSEGLSIALLEALSFGLPVITTHQGKTHDVIASGIHGFISPPNSPEELALKLEKLWLDKALQNSIKMANQKLVEQSFELKTTVDRYMKLYNEIIFPNCH